MKLIIILIGQKLESECWGGHNIVGMWDWIATWHKKLVLDPCHWVFRHIIPQCAYSKLTYEGINVEGRM